jgi:hypothetical protein
VRERVALLSSGSDTPETVKVIFSRKGFDSSAGGKPSPQIGDRLISLPIPSAEDEPGDPYSTLRSPVGGTLGDLMAQLGTKTVRLDRKTPIPTREALAHFDPQVEQSTTREGVLGHSRSAVALLERQHVRIDDLFLFFGWFRPAIKQEETYRWERPQKNFHAIWGYLQVGEIIDLATARPDQTERFHWHPHVRRFSGGDERGDRLYVAAPRLTSELVDLPGSGHLVYAPLTRLTARNERRRSRWRLPRCFDPQTTPISGLGPLIGTRERFKRDRDGFLVNSGGRGQEFVATANEPVLQWLRELLVSARVPASN